LTEGWTGGGDGGRERKGARAMAVRGSTEGGGGGPASNSLEKKGRERRCPTQSKKKLYDGRPELKERERYAKDRHVR